MRSMAGGISIERHVGGMQGVWALTLTHTGKFNAMSRSMWAELKSVMESVRADPQARCVLVRGDGGHFCAGGDIAEYPSFRFDAAALRHFHEQEVWGGLQAMLDCDVPLVAVIEGNCMGAGMEIASCCDIRLATHSARFGAPIARLGFPMAPREAALVGRVAGATVARAMLLAAEIFEAPAMLGHSFLTRMVSPSELDAAAREWAARMAGLAPQAARLNKQTLRESFGASAQVEYVQVAPNLIANNASDPYAYADSPEHREGISAFLDKRKPAF
jgi:enoyl-CoA hydratase